MKIKIASIILVLLALTSCNDLDLNPLSESSSENWYSNATEIEMSLNNLYLQEYWPVEWDGWTDDWCERGVTNEITGGTINGEWGTAETVWANAYKVIARSCVIIEKLKEISGDITEEKIKQYEGDARFNRAAKYSLLISLFGDVVFYTSALDLDEVYDVTKTSKDVILQQIYDDFDFAATWLPESYDSDETQRATKGAAYAMKARIALYMGDYETARDAAKACMDLGVYVLYPKYSKLFLSSTKNSVETILAIPRSVELYSNYYSEVLYDGITKYYITRNSGGWAVFAPSWELFSSFLCTDGLPIDESPLYDPHNPFENRDPRCSCTITEFQTEHLGFIYQPHPDSTTVYSFSKEKYVKNSDTRSVAQYASYNGLVWKKGIDEDWSDDFETDPDKIIMRYADVLLMYAEAKIELNNIDESVLNAINQVRARAYGVSVDNTSLYPAVTTTDQTELRKILRIERRMEFALESRRYMDIIRWELAEKVLNRPNYGMLDVNDLREKVVNKGLWFFPSTPEIDEDGIADFSSMYNAGLIKLIGQRYFDASKQYLWPIPNKDILVNDKIEQNPGY